MKLICVVFTALSVSTAIASDWICERAVVIPSLNGPEKTFVSVYFPNTNSTHDIIPLNEKVHDFLASFKGDSICLKGRYSHAVYSADNFYAYDVKLK